VMTTACFDYFLMDELLIRGLLAIPVEWSNEVCPSCSP
jgi:hypothetical protein